MNLILPDISIGSSKHPILLSLGHFYWYKDVAGCKATVPNIIHEIHPIPRTEALRWLCSLSKAILAEGGMSPKAPIHWAQQLFPADWCQKLEEMMQTRSRWCRCDLPQAVHLVCSSACSHVVW